MSTVALTLKEIEDLARRAFVNNGCDEPNTEALVRTVVTAERDGSHSHGLFRVPGYVASLRSGKVNGAAQPDVQCKTQVCVRVEGVNRHFPVISQQKL